MKNRKRFSIFERFETYIQKTEVTEGEALEFIKKQLNKKGVKNERKRD